MPTVHDILKSKGPGVTTVPPSTTVYEAATLMNERKIGALVVTVDTNIVGMFTERDILRRIVAQRRDPATTRIDDVMTTEVVCCQAHTQLDEAGSVMKNRRIRHLPVVDDHGHLIGVISIGDLNAFNATSQEQTIHLLQEYIGGQR